MTAPAGVDASYREALALHGAGELERAERLYGEILVMQPAHFEALHLLGVVKGQRERYEEAAALIRRAIGLRGDVAAAHNNLGNVLHALARHGEALDSYERAVALQPGHIGALRGRGDALWLLERRDEALDCYNQVLALQPDHAETWIAKGSALSSLGRFEEAFHAFRHALDFDRPRDAERVRHVLAELGQAPLPQPALLGHVTDIFDRYAARFDEHLVETLDYRTPQTLLEAARPRLRPRMDVLDLGCGTGLCGPLLRPWAGMLTGIDLSEQMLARAREKQLDGEPLYDVLACAEITQFLAERRAEWDAVFAADVFVYIGNLAGVFDAVRAALRPGGVFAFSAEPSDGADHVLGPALRFGHSEPYLRRLAAERGFEVVSWAQAHIRRENERSVCGHAVVLVG